MSAVMSAVIHAEFNGKNGSGSISVPGLRVGDVVLATVLPFGGTPYAVTTFGSYESIVSVNDQLQQIDTRDFSLDVFKMVFFRGSP